MKRKFESFTGSVRGDDGSSKEFDGEIAKLAKMIVHQASFSYPPLPIIVSGSMFAGKAFLASKIRHHVAKLRRKTAVHDVDNYLRNLDDPLLSRSPEDYFRVCLFSQKAYHADQICEHAMRIYQGHPIEMPLYNFTHSMRIFGKTRRIDPADHLIVKGRFANSLLQEFPSAVRVHLETAEEICRDRYVAHFPFQDGLMISAADIFNSIWEAYQFFGGKQKEVADFSVKLIH